MSDSDPRTFRAVDAMSVILIAFLLLITFVYLFPKQALNFANLALPMGVLIGAFYRRQPVASVLSFGTIRPIETLWNVVGTAGIFCLLMSLYQPLMDLFPRDYTPELEQLERAIFDIPPVLAWFLLVIFAPFCEETFFRGALLRGFRNSWGTFAGIGLSSALFGVIHGIPPRMVATFLIGMWLGGLAVRTGGLAAPFLAHALNNSLVLAVYAMGRESFPTWWAAPAGGLVFLSAWRLFRTPARSVQGSGPPAAS